MSGEHVPGRSPALPFFRGLAALGGGHAATKILAFLVFTMLARTLDADGYAAIEYLISLSLLFATIVESGFGVAGVRRILRDGEDVSTLAAQIPALRLGLALMSAPVMVLVAQGARLGVDVQGVAWLFALSLLPAAWRQDWLLQATGRLGEAAMAHALRMAVFAMVIVILVRDSGQLLVIGWAEVAAVAAMSLYTIGLQQARITPFRLRPPVTGLLALTREGMALGVANIVWTANQYAPVLLAATLVGAGETAWLAAASRLVGSLLAFSYVYFFGLYPAIARATARPPGELAQLLAASFRVTAWSGILLAMTLTLLATPLCVGVFGSRFAPSAPMVAVMAWGLPIVLLSGHARWALVAAGRQSGVVVTHLSVTIVLAAIGIPLVLAGGGLGAAAAWLVATVAGWVVAHALATGSGARLPPVTLALRPVSLALVVLAAARGLALTGWSAGLGALVFAAVAPLADRRLLPDLARLGATRPDASGSPDVVA